MYTGHHMGQAARAIIVENGKILLMHRNKYNSKYFTLVGGRLNDNETPEQAVVREVFEETGLQVTSARLVYYEDHPEPYNKQFIFLCTVAPHDKVAIQEMSEEGMMNRIGINVHEPVWADIEAFERTEFRTPMLQRAILDGLKYGFPQQPLKV